MQFNNLEQALAMRTICEQSQMYFTRYFFALRERQKMTVNWHHYCIARAFDMVANLVINRLVITLPPGFTKTMFLLDFMAKAYANYEMSRNIHITYNSQLSNSNSQALLDTIELPEYKSWWNVRLRQDSSAKRRWHTKHGGGLVASGVNGTIMGFRAGRLTPGFFSGCMTLDDLLKASDAYSKLTRDRVNGSMNNTIRTRLMTPATPIILTMQRLHDNDPVGFVLRGGTGDYWHHLNIPVKMTKENMQPGKAYARKYPYAIPLLFDDLMQPGYTWPVRVNKKELAIIKKGNPYVAAAHYEQNPTLIEGNFIKGKWLHYYRELPDLKHFKRVVITADTALEKKSHNDRTAFIVWGAHTDGHVYILDYGAHHLDVLGAQTLLMDQWHRWRDSHVTKLPRCQIFFVEKKASGHGIIQHMNREGVNVQPVERNIDKISRAMSAIPALRTGQILFPAKKIKTQFTSNRQWQMMVDELMAFSANMDHAFDDICDCIFDGADIFYNKTLGITDAFGN